MRTEYLSVTERSANMVFQNVFMSLQKNTVESLGSEQSSERLFSRIIDNNSPQGVDQINIVKVTVIINEVVCHLKLDCNLKGLLYSFTHLPPAFLIRFFLFLYLLRFEA